VYLKRVTITGFKSFAAKTVLDLEPGVTAVVGPNGSGKSNLADAIRWALGEQSKARLRLSDKEEVVFAGTHKRARASFAEVVLLFDNEDGAFPLDLTQVQISRRLYRSGESDYRLAGRSVRLSDIQALMAQAGFGIGTYAVIGQGMIDSFLASPPAERKVLFDEAVGIRAPEQSRQNALRKLEQTRINLVRLKDVQAELSPRLRALTNPSELAATSARLQTAVHTLRAQSVAASLRHWTSVQTQTDGDLNRLAGLKVECVSRLSDLEKVLQAIDIESSESRTEHQKLQDTITSLEADRDQASSSLVALQAQITAATGSDNNVRSLERDLKKTSGNLERLRGHHAEIVHELAANAEAGARASNAVSRAAADVSATEQALVQLRHSTDGSRDTYVTHALHVLRSLATSLSEPEPDMEAVRLLVHKAGRLLSHAAKTDSSELMDRVKAAQKKVESAMLKRETAIEHQTNVIITGRSLEMDLVHQQELVVSAEEQMRALEAQITEQQKLSTGRGDLTKELSRKSAAAHEVSAQLLEHREHLASLTSAPVSSQAVADAAAKLERARIELEDLGDRADEQSRVARDAAAHLAKCHGLVEKWQLAEPLPATSRAPHEIEIDLVKAEAALEAHLSSTRDLTSEYEAADSRQKELSDQITDLEAADRNLQQVVTELEQRIQDRFKSNFATLSTEFGKYFTRLFGGGTAKLVLERDGSEYGISIMVSPKGRHSASLAALSGGERALAGVALLAAILHTNPSPFVVLDEIDAALDEANSSHLASILRELASHTQLIVITHNRQTMHAARVLFGITMDEQNASNLLSMRLEEATQMAARG